MSHFLLRNILERNANLKTSIVRSMFLAATFGLLAILLTYSSATAENQSEAGDEYIWCTADTLGADTDSLDESLLTSEVTVHEEVEPACYICWSHSDCGDPGDGYCSKPEFSAWGCCYFY